jgi:threonine dehydrogenase-like Zn-dependent dehydrogenase
VVAGFMPGEGIGLVLGEEFHHNRIELVCSQISAVGSRVGHRWNRLRLSLEQTVMQYVGSDLQLEPLISHVFKPKDAVQAYKLLDENTAEAVQVVLDFRDGV